VGIQLLFWTVSGAYFSLVHIKTIRGEDRKSEQLPRSFAIGTEIISPQGLIAQYGRDGLTEVRLQPHEKGATYALFFGTRHPRLLVDATTGVELPHKSVEEAAAAARSDYGVADMKFKSPVLLHEAPSEYRGPLPVFQVAAEDGRATRLYLSPVSGDVISRRDRYWRIFDFLWMLHIMDFQERENFNNNLLRFVSILSIGVVVSGYALWATSRRWGKRKTRKIINPK
jgi:hypothetical protein